MGKIKIYEYKNCSTCKKALKFLDSQKISYEKFPIVENPPRALELKRMLAYMGGDFKKLFNTSGEQYRELKISEKIKAGLSEAEALSLLAKNGKLVKRPFLLTDHSGVVGFNEQIWLKVLQKT